jgi:hypothetical protein
MDVKASCFPSQLNGGEFSSRSGRCTPEKIYVGTDWRLGLNIVIEKNLLLLGVNKWPSP